MADYILKDEDVVELPACRLMGSFDKGEVSYNYTIKGKVSVANLRGILEHASSLKVRSRKFKNDLKACTWDEMINKLGGQKVVYIEKDPNEMTEDELEAKITEMKLALENK